MRILPGAPAPLTPELQRLYDASHQFEGIFLAQMFRAMRDAVPSEDATGDAGRELFTAMRDDTLAGAAAAHMHNGLGDALYRQLSRRLAAATETSVADPASRRDGTAPGAVR
jgi:Rod binding domain-containing protein